jgi:HPt (histidine-containing phosphotransfer) domain-containing protein
MIDWECLRMLHQEMNSDDFDEIVEMFFDEIEPVITRLPDVDAAPTLAGDLHFLKSGALNLGFERFAALCSAGEAAADP